MRTTRGFTLIELLVAMAIVAVIGIMALGGLSEVIRQQTVAQERAERWREIQFAMRIITQDLAQIHPRPMRDELGDTWQPSLLVSPNALFAMEISRGGWANPAGLQRGTTLRVAYDWEEDGTLVRFHWPVMDRAPGTVPIRTELLEDVAQVDIRLFDQSGTEHFEWPPTSMAGPDTLVMRPRFIRFGFELDDFGLVWRDIETGG